mmetsp:Transcript_12442/g.15579  ORF Transcript_12442/g.15579 Transcript_12442/m.15579 type:complete len:180 (-) Transcript_12442:8-547(-)
MKKKQKKPKLTKEERRVKFTQKARDRRDENFKKKRNRNITCYMCRKKGHTAAECTDGSVLICYRCGSTEHTLNSCRKKGDGLPYAKCFVCGEMGHLASSCEKNQNGIFVKGGACRECGGNDHIALNCPVKEMNDQKRAEEDEAEGIEIHLNECLGGDDEPTIKEEYKEKRKKKKKVVNF